MIASFVIPFPLARLDNVMQTLRFLEYYHLDVVEQAEIVLMCQDRCGKIDTKFAKYQLHNMKCPYMEKCKLVNRGVAVSQSDVLVMLDSDRILPPGYFKDVIGSLKEGAVVTTKTIHHLSRPYGDQDIKDKKYQYVKDTRTTDNTALNRNLFAGNVVLTKADFLKAGGMDEEYVGYGFEDHDMTNRLLAAGIQPVWRDEIELHLHHEGQTYGIGDQKRMFIDNGLRYCRKWNLPIPPKLQAEINAYTRNLV